MLRKLLNGLRQAIWPLSLIYKLITSFRNFLYDKGLLSSYQSAIYTLSIGNLTVGGTGKTPHIEYLIRLLGAQYSLAVLSRGYGRKTKGFIQANQQATANDIGDEPRQIYQKYANNVPVFVCEKRTEGLQKIETTLPKCQIVLLDDAFQHRAVTPHLNLLLTDYGRLFYQDELLPMGLLRESKYGATRAQAVVVTKCPLGLDEKRKSSITKKISHFTKAQTPVFFSHFSYSIPFPYFDFLPPLDLKTSCWLVSGIALPQIFEVAAANSFKIAGHDKMKDHHTFTKEEVQKWAKISLNYPILTTEKDWVKIKPLLEEVGLTQHRFYYWPIEVRFDASSFDEFILTEVAKQSRV